jgi:tRNA(fMet)-specific endonuclease VapC
MTHSAMLDTNIISSMMRQGQGRLWQRVERYGVANQCVSVISVCELRYGADHRGSVRLHNEISEILTVIEPVPFTPPVAEVYGRLRQQLTAIGKLIGPNDLFIAAHALALDLTLVTDNIGEFSRVPDLRVENWLD